MFILEYQDITLISNFTYENSTEYLNKLICMVIT